MCMCVWLHACVCACVYACAFVCWGGGGVCVSLRECVHGSDNPRPAHLQRGHSAVVVEEIEVSAAMQVSFKLA